MNLEPLRIKEAVNGVIKMSALEGGGTAIIPPRPDPLDGDEIDVFINGKLVATVVIGESDNKEIELQVPKHSFLDHSGIGQVPFTYTLYQGGGGNGHDSKSVSYEIHLAALHAE